MRAAQVYRFEKPGCTPGFSHIPTLSVIVLILPFHLPHLPGDAEGGLGDARDEREGLQDFEDCIHRHCLRLRRRRPHTDTAGTSVMVPRTTTSTYGKPSPTCTKTCPSATWQAGTSHMSIVLNRPRETSRNHHPGERTVLQTPMLLTPTPAHPRHRRHSHHRTPNGSQPGKSTRAGNTARGSSAPTAQNDPARSSLNPMGVAGTKPSPRDCQWDALQARRFTSP